MSVRAGWMVALGGLVIGMASTAGPVARGSAAVALPRDVGEAPLAPAVDSERPFLEYVTVGNPGNPHDVHRDLTGRAYGSVSYVYRVGKYEVTAGQYCAFLNAVAADDPHGLYDPAMKGGEALEDSGCRIQQHGPPGQHTYEVAPEWAERPVNFVNFWDACRFANWLHNGRPSGPQDASSTEDGVYTLNGYGGSDGSTIRRNPRARVWIPGADEWYKAAYHKNDGVTGHYWDYPTGTDRRPDNTLRDPDPGNCANFAIGQQRRDFTLGPPYWRTPVGEFENSASPCGTFDQAGNVREWTEDLDLALPNKSMRRQHGASYASPVEYAQAGQMGVHAWGVEVGNAIVGFRVAAARVIHVDEDAVDGGDGATWAQAYSDLSDALAEAGASARPVEIRIAQGVYRPGVGGHAGDSRDATFLLDSGVTLRGGYAGLAGPDPDARDTALYETVLSGDLKGDDVETAQHPYLLSGRTRADNSLHVVTVRGGHHGPALLEGLTISGGNAESWEIFPCFSPQRCGGGLHSQADEQGGPCEIVVISCLFKSNAAGMSGGAIYHHGADAMTLIDCVFAANCAQYGGAVAADGCRRGVVTLSGCTLVGNRSLDGGALHVQAASRLRLTACAFSANRATRGAAVFMSADANAPCDASSTICLFAGNRAERHAWVVLDDQLAGGAASSGVALPGVPSVAHGGALYLAGPVRSLLAQGTFASNTAQDGGTLTCSAGPENAPGRVEVRNCILWDEQEHIRNIDGWPVSVAYSDVRGGRSRVNDPAGGLLWGPGNIDADPGFAAPGDWDTGGTPGDESDDFWHAGDYHLKSPAGRWDPVGDRWVIDEAASPCIDAGDPAVPVGDEPPPNGNRVNMGVYGGTAEAGKSGFMNSG